MSNREKHLVFDISNLLYRTFHKSVKAHPESAIGMALHSAFVTLMKYYRMVKPDLVVMAFDRSSWRKSYTASDACLSKAPYKGNRTKLRKEMSPTEKAIYAAFKEHLVEFEHMISSVTKVVSLAADQLEADDLMSGWVQMYHKDADITLITTDSDMSQLLKFENVTIISPATSKPVTLDKFDGDPEYFLYTKCIRGDDSDNIMSAFPRVRQTRIRKAYDDNYEHLQLMEATWTDHDGNEVRVGDRFAENRLLIDLLQQPEDIAQLIVDTIVRGVEDANNRTFKIFDVVRFCGKHELQNIQDRISDFAPMLS